MQNESQWLDLYKKTRCISTDYKLAQEWKTTTSRISQIRKQKQKIRLAEIIEISKALEIEPIEIIASLEFKRAREEDQESIKNLYFESLLKTIGKRMSAVATARRYSHKYRK